MAVNDKTQVYNPSDRKKEIIDKFPNSLIVINNSLETQTMVSDLQIIDITTDMLKAKLSIDETGVSLDELRLWLEKINKLKELLNEISDLGINMVSKHYKTKEISYRPLREKVAKIKANMNSQAKE